MIEEIRFALRQLRRNPTHVAAVIFSLGIGMAVCVAMFSRVNAFVFTAVPGISDRPHLVSLRWRDGGTLFTSAEFEAIEQQSTAFSTVAAEADRMLPVSLPSGPAARPAAFVSPRFFDTLGTSPVRGRLLSATDTDRDAPPVVVIGEALWHNSFNADPEIIGRALTIGDRPVTILGITPAGFPGLRRDIAQGDGDAPQISLPLRSAPPWLRESAAMPWLAVAGRLGRTRSLTSAQAEVAVLGTRLPSAPSARHNAGLDTFRAGLDWREDFWDALLAVGFFLFVPLSVLAIGCANVVNLQLSRATERSRELSVRLALGASRTRLVRLLGMEVVVLAAVAGVVGWQGARLTLRAAESLFGTPLLVDTRVLVFMLLLVTGVIAVSGFAPAWLATRAVIAMGLKDLHDDGVRHTRVRGMLIVLQVAASLALLYISGLGVRTLQARSPVVPMDAHQILVADFSLADVHTNAPNARGFIDAVLGQLAHDHAVSAAGFSDSFGIGRAMHYAESTDDQDSGRPVSSTLVTPQWFDAMGIRLLAGREFQDVRSDATAAVVNRSLASVLGGSDRSVIGRRLRVAPPGNPRPRVVEIVGVVADHWRSEDGSATRMIFLPMPAAPPASLALVVRAANVEAATRAIRSAVSKADPLVPWVRFETLDARLGDRFKTFREVTWFGTSLGAVALVLAAAGLYAVMAYTVRRRTREIGIRIAIGATPGDVVALVLRQGLAFVLLGIVLGLLIAAPLASLMRSVFLGISPLDPATVVATLGLLVFIAALSAALPACQAVRVDPVAALRAE